MQPMSHGVMPGGLAQGYAPGFAPMQAPIPVQTGYPVPYGYPARAIPTFGWPMPTAPYQPFSGWYPAGR